MRMVRRSDQPVIAFDIGSHSSEVFGLADALARVLDEADGGVAGVTGLKDDTISPLASTKRATVGIDNLQSGVVVDVQKLDVVTGRRRFAVDEQPLLPAGADCPKEPEVRSSGKLHRHFIAHGQ